MRYTRLDEPAMRHAVKELSSRSPTIREIVGSYGDPPLWLREPGFSSLVYTILEQQVSLASAKAAYTRLLAAVTELTADQFLRLGDAELKSIGFSRQKTGYCREVAHLISTGDLNLDALTDSSDEVVRETLIAIKGIGNWTADIYLLHSLGRVDVWPTGDIALRTAVKEALDLSERPSEEELSTIGIPFKPWRSVASRVFWHSYLSRRGVSEIS